VKTKNSWQTSLKKYCSRKFSFTFPLLVHPATYATPTDEWYIDNDR